MDMIGHNHIFVNRQVKTLRQMLYFSVHNLANREEQSSSPNLL